METEADVERLKEKFAGVYHGCDGKWRVKYGVGGGMRLWIDAESREHARAIVKRYRIVVDRGGEFCLQLRA